MRDHSRALRSFLSAHSTFAPRRQPYHMLIEGINMEIILEIGIYKGVQDSRSTHAKTTDQAH